MWGPGLFSDIGKWTRELLEKIYDHGQKFPLLTRGASAAAMLGPGLFSDIGKWTREVLEDDYDHGQIFTLSAGSGSFMTTISRRSGVYGEISRFKYDKIINDTKWGLKSASLRKISLILKQLSVVKSPNDALFPNFCWRGPNAVSCDSGQLVEMQCFHDSWTVAGAMDLKLSPTFNLSGTVGVRDAVRLGASTAAVLGASVGYDTSSNTLTKLDAGISLTHTETLHPVLTFLPHSVLTYFQVGTGDPMLTFFRVSYTLLLMDKGDSHKQSFAVDHIFGEHRFALAAEIIGRISTKNRTGSFGLLYACDPFTMKVKMSYGLDKLELFFQHQLEPNIKLKVSSEHDMRHIFNNPRLGLALAINL